MVIDRLITENSFNKCLDQCDVNDRIPLVVIEWLEGEPVIVQPHSKDRFLKFNPEVRDLARVLVYGTTTRDEAPDRRYLSDILRINFDPTLQIF